MVPPANEHVDVMRWLGAGGGTPPPSLHASVARRDGGRFPANTNHLYDINMFMAWWDLAHSDSKSTSSTAGVTAE